MWKMFLEAASIRNEFYVYLNTYGWTIKRFLDYKTPGLRKSIPSAGTLTGPNHLYGRPECLIEDEQSDELRNYIEIRCRVKRPKWTTKALATIVDRFGVPIAPEEVLSVLREFSVNRKTR